MAPILVMSQQLIYVWIFSTDPCEAAASETNDNVDISISDVKWFNLNTNNPSVEKAILKEKDLSKDQFIGDERNLKSIPKTINEVDDNIDDFYIGGAFNQEGKLYLSSKDGYFQKTNSSFKKG